VQGTPVDCLLTNAEQARARATAAWCSRPHTHRFLPPPHRATPFPQITNAPRSSGKEVIELHECVKALVTRINTRFGSPGVWPLTALPAGWPAPPARSPARNAPRATRVQQRPRPHATDPHTPRRPQPHLLTPAFAPACLPPPPRPPGYEPVHYLERHVPLHERIAFLSVADVAVVTATRDGMNLLPYEYVVCR
jgi:hypothetical protein